MKSRDWIYLPILFVVATSVKVLLVPSYYSTDLLVHRHWKAVTRHLRPKDWYWDHLHVDTVHTLDYPPLFAAFEALASSNPLTQHLLRHQWVDDWCLQLLPDDESAPSEACVAFLRGTVMASDVLLWLGAWRIATVAAALLAASSSSSAAAAATTTAKPGWSGAQRDGSQRMTAKWTLFLLVVFHPGLLWLDHVHFQYNGMLLGILLLSLSYLLQPPTKNSGNLLAGAFWFACLINLKHLYLTLSLWYFGYLLRGYCYVQGKFQLRRFVTLGSVTAATLLLPWAPLLLSSPEPWELLQQILKRLFPFQRGLVHDYWAANVWALYMAASKVRSARFKGIPAFDETSVSPRAVALLLLLSLAVGAWQAWKAAESQSRTRLLLSFLFSALVSFQVGYHVHEKAIMTTLVPMLVLLFIPSIRASTSRLSLRSGAPGGPFPVLLWEITAWGLLGLFPLLFESRELALKVTSYVAYMSILYFVCFEWDKNAQIRGVTVWWIRLNILGLLAVFGALEVVPMSAWGRFEYAPLALTSVACGSALVLATLRLTYRLLTLPQDLA
jgi:alpha-1,3-glucosyltransferase